MKRKSICLILIAVLACLLALGLVSCNKDNYTIVYLGDSIAEALIGPSPLSERDNYGYYAIVGKTNGFDYYNHSVSGHKTSTGIVSGEGLLEIISREEEDAVLMQTHIRQADMLHISVLGNNLLQYDLGLLMLEVADPQFESKYANQKNTLINALEDGSMDEPMVRNSVDKVDEQGNPEQVEFAFPPTYSNICDIVDRLTDLNPTATIVFQKVYNPFFEGSKHLTPAVLSRLSEIADDGRFGAQGQPIATTAQVRKLADYLLGYLNGMLDRYLAEHPNSIKILDAREAFESVVQRDKKEDGSVNLAGDSLGRKLIYNDWTHPSNLGHAVIAELTQNLLDEMGVSSKKALKNYKNLRIGQINELYRGVDGFDADGAVAAIKKADSYLDVTLAYFGATEGYTPVVKADKTATNNKKTSFSSARRFEVDFSKTSVMGIDSMLLNLVFLAAGNAEMTYAQFETDGSMHFQLQTADNVLENYSQMIQEFLPKLVGYNIEGAIDSMIEPMFPGFKAKLKAADLKGALGLIEAGLGFNIEGLNYEDEGVKEIVSYIAQNMSIPEFIFEKLPKDTVLKLTFDGCYCVRELTAWDGTTYTGVYIGEIGEDTGTQPYCVFNMYTDEYGDTYMTFTAEFMNATVTLKSEAA